MQATRDSLVKAMEGHFRRTVEEYSGLSFPETKVQMPTASFERYADAILEAHPPERSICHECGEPTEHCGCMPF